MDYIQILKKSWELIKKNKFLWFLGFLSAGASSAGSGNYYSYGDSDYQDKFKEIQNGDNIALLKDILGTVKAQVSPASKVLGESIGPGAFDNFWLWLALAIGVLILIIALIYVAITEKSAIIWAVSELGQNKVATLGASWKAGHRYFWRRLSLAVVVFFILFLPLMVLSIPVTLLAIFNQVILAVIVGIVFGLAYIVYAIYINLFIPYSERYLVLGNVSATKALSESKKLFGLKWGEIVLVYLIIFGIRTVFTLAMFLALFSAMLTLILPSYLLILLNSILGGAYIAIFVIAILVSLVVLSSALNAYASSCVTLAYERIKD
ncbi:hypothetical protein A2215_01285 [Candidatus Berkelbacteria bacterium RIFOXYA2_FULL_43_10]|uniref:Glycerophosphoryl diester phosphodiesterase membrane domain-containing protein n=1 Tax=Candidatus Berkelbacteria bacterium RIFOXYA2_FULL_43_10 TaxID=1797472 RepID=A0A1F5E9K4_9BACT|nr:MAG: hypothetical protein A2215_01285 [Candidatus Berkelbacteria bacterium RIFOXYA2_FULL_43_10]